jgi:hypothetical protein
MTEQADSISSGFDATLGEFDLAILSPGARAPIGRLVALELASYKRRRRPRRCGRENGLLDRVGLLEPCSCAGSDGFWTSPFAWSVLAGMGCRVLDTPASRFAGSTTRMSTPSRFHHAVWTPRRGRGLLAAAADDLRESQTASKRCCAPCAPSMRRLCAPDPAW